MLKSAKFIKAFTLMLALVVFGALAMQSCKEKAQEATEEATEEVQEATEEATDVKEGAVEEAEAVDTTAGAEEGKCGEGKCGEGKCG